MRRERSERIEKLGDRLVEIGNGINWDDLRTKLDILFCNNTEHVGRPNIDVIVMLRYLFIQQLYSLSDEQLEIKLADRISFRMFWEQQKSFPIPLRYGNSESALLIAEWIRKFEVSCKNSLMP